MRSLRSRFHRRTLQLITERKKYETERLNQNISEHIHTYFRHNKIQNQTMIDLKKNNYLKQASMKKNAQRC